MGARMQAARPTDEAATRPAERPVRLPLPETGAEHARSWVTRHLGDVAGDACPPSPRFRGGQGAAHRALAAFDVRGYAAARSAVWPTEHRGASALSPFIRHGLLPLRHVWEHVEGGPPRDVARFRDELLWQEYARHVYARLGRRTAEPLRFDPATRAVADSIPVLGETLWPPDMACLAAMRSELEQDGWVVNQARMWMASHASVRAGVPWRIGEDHFFRHLLDGSRAANRLGWQWTVGAATGKPYGFSRWQVEKRAPALCRSCGLRGACPISAWPDPPRPRPVGERPTDLGRVDVARTGAGPATPLRIGAPEAVWITAESLGDADPALAAHPELPVVFVFDAPRLARWRLSAKRLAFLTETLAELATRRRVELWRGEPLQVLEGRALAATYTPVPGWRAISVQLDVAVCHPWPWLRRPHERGIGSFSAWRKGLGR